MKVLSWNILANEYIKKQYYPQVKEELLIREDRFKLISSKLKEINADIILLQEVMSAEYKNLKELLSHKYFISKLYRKYATKYSLDQCKFGPML